MARVYRIKPLEKKSIHVAYEMFRTNNDGTISCFNIEDHYRWGQGFVEEDMSVNLPTEGDKVAYCKNDCGWGAELDDQVACWFSYSDDITQEERDQIEEAYNQGGAGWLYDGDHGWEFEDDYIVVVAPFQVDLCEDSGIIVEENIKLKPAPAATENNAAWPFPTH